MSSERNLDETESSAAYRGESRLRTLSEAYNKSLEEWWHRECHLSAETGIPYRRMPPAARQAPAIRPLAASNVP